MMNNTEAVREALLKANSIALVSHINPDGDAIGSALAMKLGLEQLGKKVSAFCQDKVPDDLLMLPGSGSYRTEAPGEHFDLLCAIDVSAPDRMGSCEALLQQADATAQIDHHGTNPLFMQHNDVDGDSCAAAIPVFRMLTALGAEITADIAACLYTGIATDSGNFAYDAVNEETFLVMAALKKTGFKMTELNRRLFRCHPAAQVKLLSRALSTLRFHADGKVTSMVLTQKDFEECGALPEHANTVVNYGIDIDGVRATALVREMGEGRCKASLRAVAPGRVDEIAHSHGGGGHPQASGCSLTGTVDEYRSLLVSELTAMAEAIG